MTEVSNYLSCVLIYCFCLKGFLLRLLLPELPVLCLGKQNWQQGWRTLWRQLWSLSLSFFVALKKGVDRDTNPATLGHCVPQFHPGSEHAAIKIWRNTGGPPSHHTQRDTFCMLRWRPGEASEMEALFQPGVAAVAVVCESERWGKLYVSTNYAQTQN